MDDWYRKLADQTLARMTGYPRGTPPSETKWPAPKFAIGARVTDGIAIGTVAGTKVGTEQEVMIIWDNGDRSEWIPTSWVRAAP